LSPHSDRRSPKKKRTGRADPLKSPANAQGECGEDQVAGYPLNGAEPERFRRGIPVHLRGTAPWLAPAWNGAGAGLL
jgi:hypothetical protein